MISSKCFKAVLYSWMFQLVDQTLQKILNKNQTAGSRVVFLSDNTH